MSWSAKQHVAFEDERTRPVRDLLSALPDIRVRSVVDEGFSRCEDAIEQFEESRAFHLGNSLANSQPDDIAVTDELMIGRVGQYESVLRPLKKCGKARRPCKHLSHGRFISRKKHGFA